MNITLVPEIAAEAKALVALAFRNGPIEELHAGKLCPTCSGQPEFSRISDEELKTIMKSAVDTLYRLLWQREYDPEKYQRNVALGLRYTKHWDDPELRSPVQTKSIPNERGGLMFKELAPYLRQRAVLLTVTHLEDEQIRVNIVPQKLKDGENAALTTPLTVSGSAEELDRELPATVINFVSAHLELKNTLDRAKAEIDAAAKAAQAEARSKTKAGSTKVAPKPEPAKASENAKPVPQTPSESPRVAGLFDSPEPAPGPGLDEEKEIPAEHQVEFSDEEDEDEAA